MLLASEMHRHSEQAKQNQEESKAILKEGFAQQQRPPWKLWTPKDWLQIAIVTAGIMGAVNWERVIPLLTTLASAAGAK